MISILVTADECPVCDLGPIGYMVCKAGVYLRCVDCTSYWPVGVTPLYDNTLVLSDAEKEDMRPATIEEVKDAGPIAGPAGRWSHADGFTPL